MIATAAGNEERRRGEKREKFATAAGNKERKKKRGGYATAVGNTHTTERTAHQNGAWCGTACRNQRTT